MSISPEKLHTVQVVPLTAFDEQLVLNLTVMRQLTERLFEAGVKVFIPCAGSSEFHTLRRLERHFGGDDLKLSRLAGWIG